MGGIYAGFFTPTEAAAAGAFIALIFTLVTRRFSWGNLKDTMNISTRTTAMLFLILIGAITFGRFLAIANIPTLLAEFIAGLEVSRYLVVIIILFIMIIWDAFLKVFL
jgi:TRAP-type C4-dicarboxylate transport system permease large subunit